MPIAKKNRSPGSSLQERERKLIDPPGGGKLGSHAAKAVLCYPNRYWVAMSNLGFQAIYRLLSEERRLVVDRAYLPESGSGSAWRSFERNHPLGGSDILAISVSFETDYPNVLSLLESAGVDLTACREVPGVLFREEGPLVIGGGAALTLNPEPLANYFDAIVIGEGEEVIGEILDCYFEHREAPRRALLQNLAEIQGVYVPSLYRVSYNTDHTICGFSSELPRRVKRRFVENIDAYPTHTIIQTPETEFRSMFMTETGRGCESGCRFCVAGYMYRPIRKRSADAVRATVQIGLETSDSIGFVGAAVSSHANISELTREVAEAGKRASLSSIMSQRVTPELAASLSESEYKTVALAPEAGSEALRFRVGKRVCDEQIISGVSTLAENGIRNFKLYFMVGLPSEEREDVEAISHLARLARDAALAAARRQEDFRVAPTLYLSVNPFIPKAWTPFQRHGFLPFPEIKRRIEIVRKGIARIANVEMKFESPRESYFQAVMSRGDRRVGDLLYELHRTGRDWRSLVRTGGEVLLSGVPPADFYVHRTISKDETLPWEIVDLLIKRSLLEREYERTFSEDMQPARERVRKEFLSGVSSPASMDNAHERRSTAVNSGRGQNSARQDMK